MKKGVPLRGYENKRKIIGAPKYSIHSSCEYTPYEPNSMPPPKQAAAVSKEVRVPTRICHFPPSAAMTPWQANTIETGAVTCINVQSLRARKQARTAFQHHSPTALKNQTPTPRCCSNKAMLQSNRSRHHRPRERAADAHVRRKRRNGHQPTVRCFNRRSRRRRSTATGGSATPSLSNCCQARSMRMEDKSTAPIACCNRSIPCGFTEGKLINRSSSSVEAMLLIAARGSGRNPADCVKLRHRRNIFTIQVPGMILNYVALLLSVCVCTNGQFVPFRNITWKYINQPGLQAQPVPFDPRGLPPQNNSWIMTASCCGYGPFSQAAVQNAR